MNEEQTEGVLLTASPGTNSRDLRRNSSGKVATSPSSSPSNSEGKILPRYLRTSTGSCHELCKYGRQHTFESKGRRPTFPRHIGTSGTSSEKGQNQVKLPCSAGNQKKSAIKQKAAAHSGLYDKSKMSKEKNSTSMKIVRPIQESEVNKQNCIYHERSGSSEESEIKCNFPSPSKEIEPPEVFGTIKHGALQKIELCDGSETATEKMTALLKKTDASGDSETANERKPSAEKIHLLMESASAKERTRSAKKSSASAKPEIKQKVPSPVKKDISPGKPKVSKQVAPSPANRFHASTRQVLSGKSNTTKSGKQLKPAAGIADRSVGSKIVKNVDLSERGGKKTSKPSSDSLSPQPSVNHVAPSPANRFHASTRQVLSGKSNTTKSGKQLQPAAGVADRSVGSKIVKNVYLSERGGKKTSKPSSDSLSPQPSVNHVSKSASPVKHAKEVKTAKLKNDKISEKTLYIIGTGPIDDENIESSQSKSSSCQPSPLSPSLSLPSASPLSSSSSISDHQEEEYQDSESEFSEAFDLVSDHGGDGTYIAAQNEDEKSQKRMAIVHSEYKDQIPYKLKFRRGKILNPQSDHDLSRRLRFRQGRRMGYGQSGKGEMGKNSFKMKELTCEDSSPPDPEAQAVVLRHQDVQDKKDGPGLFNHVIEETASKLVETRKSKVKALVGAFETVISLQESKPATSV